MVQKEGTPNIKDIDARFRVKIIARELAESDAMMIRALEDLMMVLLNKKIITVEEIHPVVVEKIKGRRKLRAEMKMLRERLNDKTKEDAPKPKPVSKSGLPEPDSALIKNQA